MVIFCVSPCSATATAVENARRQSCRQPRSLAIDSAIARCLAVHTRKILGLERSARSPNFHLVVYLHAKLSSPSRLQVL